MKYLLGILLLSAGLIAAQSRPVVVTWAPSTSASVTGYVISSGTSTAGPFTQIGCTGTVAGSTCLAGTTSSTLSFQDAPVIGTTVVYQITAVGPVCTSGVTPCGKASVASAAVLIPPTVNPPGPAITIVIQ